MLRSDRRSGFSKGGSLALIMVLVWGVLYGAGARLAYAADVTVVDWTELTEAFATSASGTTIRLGDHITQSSGTLAVPAGRHLTIDLAGYTLIITSSESSAPAVRVESGRSLTIEDSSLDGSGTLTATGANYAAGIGGGYQAGAGTITINGGRVTANGNTGAAGIGGGMLGDGGTITINGGTIMANGGQGAAGIGGGIQAGSGTITINDGTVYATGNNGGAGIGVGYEGNGGTIVIQGGTVTPSTGISGSISVIGTGPGGGPSSIYLTNNGTIILPADYRLIIPAGLVLHNSGTISGEGRIQGSGKLNNSGTITAPLNGPTVEGNIFALRFHLNGGSGSISPVTLYAATLHQAGMALPQPVRQGYTFAGWYTQLEGGVEVIDTYVFNSDLDVYARWRDATPPTVTLSSAARDPLNHAFTVMTTFSKAVTGFAPGDVAVLNGSVSNLSTSNNVTYTFIVTPTADGLVTVSIPSGAANDVAGNGNEASVPLTRTYDGTAPTVALSSTAADPVNGVFTVRAVFSEAVVGLSVDDITVTGGDAGSWYAQDAATYTFEITPTAEDLVTVSIPSGAVNDAAGNGNEASAPLTRTYDGTVPTVILTSTAADPVNDVFTVTATFSKAVTGFAAGDVAVLNGSVSSLITSDNVTYTFEVTPTADGLVTVSIPSGAVNDAAGNGNEESAPLTRTYDGTVPKVILSSTSADLVNGAFTVTATFSEVVTGFATSDVTVVNGEAGNVEATDAATYTFEVTPTADGLVTVSIPSGVANDAAGNGNAASASLTRTYDGTAPTVILTSTSADPVNDVFTVTATFSKAVTGFAAGDLAVLNGSVSSLITSDNVIYTFEVTPTVDGLVTVSIPSGAANDAAGNGNAASASLTRTYDGTAPTVILSSDAADSVNGAFIVTATFSEAVTGFDASDVTVMNGEAGSVEATDATTYTFTVTPTADGLVTVSIPSGAANDAAGNGNAESALLTRTYDGTAPTVTLSSVAVELVNGAFTVTATFSEAVTGFAVSDVNVVNGELGSVEAADAATYTFEVTPTADGLVTVSIPSGAANDAAGNGNEASVPLTRTYDGTVPTVILSSDAADSVNGAFTVTATFSEAVTGFVANDVTVVNGEAGNVESTDAATYTFTVTPTADGLVTVSIPSGAANDAAGNGNEASAPLTRTYDGTAPTVTLSSTAVDPVNGAFIVTATFSEAVTGIAASDVNVVNGEVGNVGSTDAATYTFEVTPTVDGLVTVSIPSGAVNDAAGNVNEASAPLTRTYDGTAPTVTLSSTAADPVNGAFIVTATFSEAVTGIAASDVTVLNGEAGIVEATDASTYTFTVTPTADGLVTVSIPSGAANDAAGNGNEDSAPLTRTYDGTAPTVTLSSTAADPVNGAFIVTATFSEAVTSIAASDVNVVNGEASSVESKDAATYTITVTPRADGLVTVSIPSGAANDAAGNGNEASASLTRTYDGTAPTVTLSSTATDPVNGAFIVTATFSEAVTGFVASDVTVVNGEASSVEATDATTYTFKVTPTADGLVAVSIPSGVANDAAGNGNEASVHLTRTYDGTAPILTIDLSGSAEPVQSARPVVTVTDDNELIVLRYTWASTASAPVEDDAAWQTFISGQALVVEEGNGERYLHVYARDAAGNERSESYGPFILDNTAPVLELIGDNPLVIAIDSSYEEPGFTAFDEQDGNITEEIVVTGSVDTQKVGTYTLLYNVSDQAGNAAAEVSRTVHVIAPPVLELTGPAEMSLVQGGTFNDPGAMATDAYYGSLSDQISVSGSVDTKTPGVYTLRYTVKNPIGQITEAVRTVTVTQAPPPYNGGGFWYPEDGDDSDPDESTDNAVELILNGRTVSVEAVKETTSDGRTMMRLRLTAEQVADLFGVRGDETARAASGGEVSVLSNHVQAAETSEAVVAIDGISEIVALELPAGALHDVRRAWPSARLRLVVDGHGMLLPLEAVKKVSAAADAVVALTIGRVSTADRDAAARTIAGLGAETLLAHPVAYALTADGRPVAGWNEAYRERTMRLLTPAGAEQATAVWMDEQGELHFVPSVFGSDGTVTMPTRQDGAYTVIRLASTFADMAGHWAQTDVEELANKQIVTGRGTGRFAPSDPVTRAEFAALLVRGLGLVERADRLPFEDVAGTDWYAGAIATASQAGLVYGYEDGTFRPQERITREQMAVMIIRAMAYAGQRPGGSSGAIPGSATIVDEEEISQWAKEAVEQLAATGIIQGLTTSTFAPQADASRAQSVVMLKRLLQHLEFINP